MPAEITVCSLSDGNTKQLINMLESLCKQRAKNHIRKVLIAVGELTKELVNIQTQYQVDFDICVVDMSDRPAIKRFSDIVELSPTDLVFAVNSDYVVEYDCLEKLLNRKDELPNPEDVVFGQIVWPKLHKVTPIQKYVMSNEGGQQHAYGRITDPDKMHWGLICGPTLWHRDFYLKHRLTGEYFYYADVEMNWKLHNDGMRGHYVQDAVVYHDHFLNVRQYVNRQIRVGCDAAKVAKKHHGTNNYFDTLNSLNSFPYVDKHYLKFMMNQCERINTRDEYNAKEFGLLLFQAQVYGVQCTVGTNDYLQF